MRVAFWAGFTILWATWSGCGTTKWTDTARTATEQLLITDSIDRSVSRLDMRALAGKKVFVDDTPAKQVTDSAYLLSAVRQHVLASGAILKDKRDDAEYILEVRAGAIGTDRHDLLFGIPPTTLPTIGTTVAVPNQIPEIAVAKKTDQRGVAKISLFAYNKNTGRPVWQSGAIPEESNAKALWVLGAGPFQRGSIRRGTTFAGSKVRIPLIDPMLPDDAKQTPVAVADEAFFVEPKEPPAETKTAQAKPTDAKPAEAKPPVANVPGPAQPASSPSSPTKEQGPVTPAAAPGDFRSPASRSSSGEVSPASAILPLGSAAAPTQSPEEVFHGDTWLDRRR